MRIPTLPRLALIALLAAGAVPALHAAVYPPPGPNNRDVPPEKPTLVATVFEVLITDEKGGTQKDRFIFADQKMGCSFLTKAGIGKIPFKESPGKEIKDPIPWTAIFADADGNKIEFKGEAVKDAISGTITLAPKLGATHVSKFIGGKAGTESARKAMASN
jgi:hypothetical protein